jgi:signal transduction histidine kinase
MPSPYREKHGEYIRRYQSSREPHVIGKTRKLTARRKDGTEFPIQLSLAEIDHLARFTGIISDITEQQTLQEDVLRIAALEQRRIGQELHDSTQQALTGLGLLAEHLSETLSESGSPQKALAAKLAAGIADVGKALRSLARGLLPGPINAGALTSALAELARSTVELGIPCHFKCPAPIRAPDDMMATHLYRIAQEAVTNAVKHSQATTISIELVNGRSDLTLRVTDDGVGIRQRDTQGKGLGLRIMRYRCALIGGDLAIRQREAGGTAVICTLPSVAA